MSSDFLNQPRCQWLLGTGSTSKYLNSLYFGNTGKAKVDCIGERHYCPQFHSRVGASLHIGSSTYMQMGSFPSLCHVGDDVTTGLHNIGPKWKTRNPNWKAWDSMISISRPSRSRDNGIKFPSLSLGHSEVAISFAQVEISPA